MYAVINCTDFCGASFVEYPRVSHATGHSSVVWQPVWKVKILLHLFFLLSDHNHQVDYFVAMVHAWYVCVAIIHETRTWTTGSLRYAQMLMHVIAHGRVLTLKEGLHWKLTPGRKSLATPANWACISGMMVQCSAKWATSYPGKGRNGVWQPWGIFKKCLKIFNMHDGLLVYCAHEG